MQHQGAFVFGKLLVSLALFAAAAGAQPGYRISTVAGGGKDGDGGEATAAHLRSPYGVALDGAGNLYIADSSSHRIRKVDSTGTISTVAGTGVAGFSGDGDAASAAQLDDPWGVALDGAGNLYIADTDNLRIRKVDSTGTISTVAGTGARGSSGDGGPATAAQLRSPSKVALDGAGNLYIADTNNQRIRKVDSTGTISTVAGTGAAGFSGDGGPATTAQLSFPWDMAVDGAGNLYIADTNNQRIRKVDSTGTISTVAGTGAAGFSGDGGPATAAQLHGPSKVALDGAGNLYIADWLNNRIRKVDSTGTISTVAGTGEWGFSGDGGPAIAAQLAYPVGVALDGAGNLYIADSGQNRIRKVDSTGTISTVAGTNIQGFSGDGGPATATELDLPSGVAVDGGDNLYIADQRNQRIRKVDSTGTISTVAGTNIQGFSGDGGLATAAQLRSPYGVALDGGDNLYIADTGNNRIRKVDSTGTISTVAGTGAGGFSGDGGLATAAQLRSPYGVAVDGAGNLYIADTDNQRIRKVDTAGTISTIAGTGTSGFSGDGGAATAAELDSPWGVALDGAGNFYIADTDNQRIRKVDSTGTISTIAGTGTSGFSGDGGAATAAQLDSPSGIAPDGAGNLYIADTDNQRIRKVDSTGTISTIAGTGTSGFSGDGGPATAAQLDSPSGIAPDGAGNLYIADWGNDRIRLLTLLPGGGGGSRTTAPSAPRNLTAVGGDGEVVLNWDAPARDGGAAVTDYEYRIDRRNPWISTGSSDTTHTVSGLDNGATYVFEVRAVNRSGRSFASNRVEATPMAPEPQLFTLDFAHFANGGGITSEVVLVNVGATAIQPVLYFSDQQGEPLDADSVVDVTADLEVREADGGLTTRTAIEPLGELTISTHGRGEQVSGSVRVVAEGAIGGVLRFSDPMVGVTGVGTAPAVRDALFPARRKQGGIRTAAAMHNVGEEEIELTCRLMSQGVVLEEVEIPLQGKGQTSWFIEQAFTMTDTTDFVGTVRCTAPREGRYTGLAVEVDQANRIFTTLPLVAVERTGGQEGRTELDFAHFANGTGIVSELVMVNVETRPSGRGPTPFHPTVPESRPVIYFYDREGYLIDPTTVVDLTEELEVGDDGGLTLEAAMEPLGELTVATHGRGPLVSGAVKVFSDGPIGGVLRYGVPMVGVTGVGTAQPVRDALFPARRKQGGIRTAAAMHNVGEEAMEVNCRLMSGGAVLEETQIPLQANGQTSWFIEDEFTGTDTEDFVGSVRCTAPEEGRYTGLAVEVDAANRIFTTLPVVAVEERTAQQ